MCCCILYAVLIGCICCSNEQSKPKKVEKPNCQNFDCGYTEENINCYCAYERKSCSSNLYKWNNLYSNCR